MAGVAAAAQVRGDAASPRASGHFYASCMFSHRAPDDSIVYPRQPGRSHLHDFFGNKKTDANSTPESLRAGGGTTCHRAADRAAYWVPTLYDSEDGKPVKPLRMSAQYYTGYRDPAAIQPFPPGLQMIAGDSSATEEQIGRVVDWTCGGSRFVSEGQSPENSPTAKKLRSAMNDFEKTMAAEQATMRTLKKAIRLQRKKIKRLRRAHASRKLKVQKRKLARKRKAYRKHAAAFREARSERDNRKAALESYLFGGGTSIPTCASDSGLQLFVRFPDCWDGQRLDSPNHKAHMEYSYQVSPTEWRCPRTHPVVVPILRVWVQYEGHGGPDVRLSPGDVDAGHGDFVNGWDQERLNALVKNCLNVDKYCGGDSKPRHDAGPAPAPAPNPSPAPAPEPSPSPSPSPDPNPQPDPDPQPEPDPDPNPLPIPLP